jgi:hypothetical protein
MSPERLDVRTTLSARARHGGRGRVAGLTKTQAEDLLDALEASGQPGFALYFAGVGYVVVRPAGRVASRRWCSCFTPSAGSPPAR